MQNNGKEKANSSKTTKNDLYQNTEDNTYDAYPCGDQAVIPNTNPLFPTIPSQDRRPSAIKLSLSLIRYT